MSEAALDRFMTDWPPALQLFGVAILGLYTMVSWAGRLNPGLSWLWSRPDHGTEDHFIGYTLIPTLIFGAAVVFVGLTWDPALPLYGSWEPSRFWRVAGAFCGGMGSLVAAYHRAKTTDISDARRLASWIPLLLGATGVGLLIACARLV